MQGDKVKAAIDELLKTEGRVSSGVVARRAGVSRQTAHAHLTARVRSGELIREGQGRGANYRRSGPLRWSQTYPARGLQEDIVWKHAERTLGWLADLPEPASRIVHYGFTEMLNNAIDHSGSASIDVAFEFEATRVAFEVLDQGDGIFEHARRILGLPSALDALQELSKGKVTTAPAAHTGQGLFFTSKSADWFTVESGTLVWTFDNRRGDVAVGQLATERVGTRIWFELDPNTARSLKAVFDAYSSEDFEFVGTRTWVKLFMHGTQFVSRSEAKRLLVGLEKFREIHVDFAGVDSVGQGFADEVFRVWANAHPAIKVLAENMNTAVEFMVMRARQHRA